jgi:uncharacterized protein with GYD domain
MPRYVTLIDWTIRTTTLRAFSRDELRNVIAKAS